MGDYARGWTNIKASFEVATKRKKPTEKFLGVFRKGSGIEAAMAALDKAIDSEEFEDAGKAFDAVDKAAKAYQKTLIKTAIAEKDKEVQKDINNMMVELHKLCEEADKEIKEVGKINKLSSLSDFAKLMRTKTGARFAAHAKKALMDENVLFLEEMVKKAYTQKSYDKFISDKATTQINLPGKLKAEFDEAAKSREWRSAPWDEAATEILKLVKEDVVPRFNKEVEKS